MEEAFARYLLSFKNRKAVSRKVRAANEEEHRLFERDPFIYFYEDYLAKYDAKMRKGRGVYYTPPPIVNFIVRAIDDTLKGEFGIKLGLADHMARHRIDRVCQRLFQPSHECTMAGEVWDPTTVISWSRR